MNKDDVVYLYNGILHGNKKEESLPFASTWMDLDSIILIYSLAIHFDERYKFSFDLNYWFLKLLSSYQLVI